MNRWTIWCLTALLTTATAAADSLDDENTLVLTATAYNSLPEQTSAAPNIGAWGDPLASGMRVVAVSRDLIAMGLTRGVEVTIEGLPGTFRVLDKMAPRWKRRIDIYMGKDIARARHWGVRRVRIHW